MREKEQCEALVVGAGPVGLFTALGLVERGVDVRIIDKEWRGSTHSYALALHPTSLALLDSYGVTAELLERGYRIERVALYDGNERAGVLDLSALDGPFPFLLVVAQSDLEQVLEQRLKEKKIGVRWNHQILAMHEQVSGVTAKIGRMEKYTMGYPIAHTEWIIAKELETRAQFLIGADGYHSFVRKQLGARFEHVGKAQSFSVFEFPCTDELAREVRLVLHAHTTNVIWPMGRNRGRWGFEVDRESSEPLTAQSLRQFIAARAPWFQPRIDSIDWATRVLFERRLVDRFGRERTWLVGDAAHVTGPVGVQSMNVGLREAHDLAGMIAAVQKEGEAVSRLDDYAEARRSEWRRLLGLEGLPQATSGAVGWAREQATRILPCVPASGEDINKLLGQIGLRAA